MEKVIQILNQMLADGIIEKFAIGGGIAAIYYLPPYHTDDVDVFYLPVLVTENGLVSLEPIYSYLAKLGYYPIREGVLIEDWPVQFVAPFKSVQEEAIIEARQVTYGNTATLIFTAEHLAAELLRSGRPKDHSRVINLIQERKLDMVAFLDIVRRHDLADQWQDFKLRYDLEE